MAHGHYRRCPTIRSFTGGQGNSLPRVKHLSCYPPSPITLLFAILAVLGRVAPRRFRAVMAEDAKTAVSGQEVKYVAQLKRVGHRGDAQP